MGVDAIAGQEGLYLANRPVTGLGQEAGFIGAADTLQRAQLEPPAADHASVAATGAGPAQICFENGDGDRWVEFTNAQRCPQTGIATADDADVSCYGARLRFYRRGFRFRGHCLVQPQRLAARRENWLQVDQCD